MSKSPKRVRQVADLIRHRVAELLKKEVSDPRLNQVSITSVDLSPDLGNAKVFFTLSDVNDLAAVNQAFAKATGYFRRLLAEHMDTRYVPKLHFVFDESLERGFKVSALIDQALNEDSKFKSSGD